MSSKTLTFYKCTVWVYSPICFFLLSPAKWGHHLLHSKGEKEPQALWVFLRGFPGSDVAFVLVLFIIRFGKCQGRAKLALLHWKRETNHTCQVNRVQPMFVEGLLYGGGIRLAWPKLPVWVPLPQPLQEHPSSLLPSPPLAHLKELNRARC